MKNAENAIIMGDIVIANGVVAKKPSKMSKEFWDKYEVPRIGKKYSNKDNIIYGQQYDENYKHTDMNVAPQDLDNEECVSCKI